MQWVDKMQDSSETRGNKNGINQKEKKKKRKLESPLQYAEGTLASRIYPELLALFLKGTGKKDKM